MPKRTCAECGREKELKGGKVCERKGHFICQTCVYKGSNVLFTYEKHKCPVCESRLK